MSILGTIFTSIGILACGAGGYAYWRHATRGQRCEALWREKRIAESLTTALDCGRLDFVKTSLARLPVRHAALSDGLRDAAQSMVNLLQLVQDPRNTYLPKVIVKQTSDDAQAVLINLFNFAQRLHLVENQGHLPPPEEAARVVSSFATTTQQAVEAHAALAKLTFSGSNAEFKSARNKVKAIAWQAEEMYTMDRMLE